MATLSVNPESNFGLKVLESIDQIFTWTINLFKLLVNQIIGWVIVAILILPVLFVFVILSVVGKVMIYKAARELSNELENIKSVKDTVLSESVERNLMLAHLQYEKLQKVYDTLDKDYMSYPKSIRVYIGFLAGKNRVVITGLIRDIVSELESKIYPDINKPLTQEQLRDLHIEYYGKE